MVIYSYYTNYLILLLNINTINKKVLLRERKRHTARRVASTPYVVLTGYPPPAGYPPILTWPGGVPTWVPLRAGYPLAGPGRVPPPPPQVSAPWHSGKCCKALWDMGTPPGCEQTNKVKLLPSRRTTYAGGKYLNDLKIWYIFIHRSVSQIT